MDKLTKEWLEKCYPKPAETFRGLELTWVNILRALCHSQRKWEYLDKKHLNRYELHMSFSSVRDRDDNILLEVRDESCALCQLMDDDCRHCVLTTIRGRACDKAIDGEESTPFREFVIKGNPKPMCKLLKKAIDYTINQIKATRGNND